MKVLVTPKDLKRISKKIISRVVRKNADYGDAWQDSGIFTPLINLRHKLTRLETLQGKQAMVIDEGIEDTLVYLVGYALLSLLWLEGNKTDFKKGDIFFYMDGWVRFRGGKFENVNLDMEHNICEVMEDGEKPKVSDSIYITDDKFMIDLEIKTGQASECVGSYKGKNIFRAGYMTCAMCGEKHNSLHMGMVKGVPVGLGCFSGVDSFLNSEMAKHGKRPMFCSNCFKRIEKPIKSQGLRCYCSDYCYYRINGEWPEFVSKSTNHDDGLCGDCFELLNDGDFVYYSSKWNCWIRHRKGLEAKIDCGLNTLNRNLVYVVRKSNGIFLFDDGVNKP